MKNKHHSPIIQDIVRPRSFAPSQTYMQKRARTKSSKRLAGLVLDNFGLNPQKSHDSFPAPEIDESLLKEASEAVIHPKQYRARDEKSAVKYTIAEHIGELRRRLLISFGVLISGGILGYYFKDQIISALTKPLGKTLFYTSPTGGFDFLIKICLFFGFVLAVPVITYQILRFIAPAIPRRAAIHTSQLLFVSMFLAIAGVCFAYYVSLPAALHFLNNFSNTQVQSLISAREYFNFVMIYLAGFAVLFQMPLLIALINKMTPLKPSSLLKKQKFIILVSFVVAAILTPTPDPINQTIMALPIIMLYQASISIVWWSQRKQKKTRRQSLFINEPVFA